MLARASCYAAVDWHWQFDQTLYTVAPNDVIDFPHHAADNFFEVVVVPEPSTIAIMSITALVLSGRARLFLTHRSQRDCGR